MNNNSCIALYYVLMTMFTLLIVGGAISVQPVYFETHFGNGIQDNARSVRELSDGSIYVAGYSDAGYKGSIDFTLNKLNNNGTLLWTHYYGDSLMNNCLYMTLTADSNLVLAGETETSAGDLDILMYKTDTAGNIIYKKQFSDTANQSAKHILQYSDSGFVLTGFCSDSGGSNNFYVIKAEANGNVQWKRSIGGTDNDYAQMSKETPEGNIIVVGDRKNPLTQEYDIGLCKLSPTGNLFWSYTYGDTLNNGSQGVLITSKNKYLIYGETEVFKGSPFNFILELVDTNGVSIWKKVFGGSLSDAIFSVTETTDGGFVCTGYSASYSPGMDTYILKTDSSGNMLWIHSYGSMGVDIGYDIIPSASSGFLIAGTTSPEDGDFYLLHVDTAGLVNNILEPATGDILKVYPNPSSGIVYMKPPYNSFSGTVNIYDLCGRLIMAHPINGTSVSINLTNQPNGIYIYKLKEKKGEIITGKIAVQH